MKVGITGGIGSGKSTVCRIFETIGIPVYYADDRAKWLMTNDPRLVEGIKALLGEGAYLSDGSLNRAHIASVIFNDKEKLARMNALVHPAVWTDGEDWHKRQSHAPYTMKEAALLFETGGYQLMDRMITVFAPKKLRLSRVMSRDGSDKAAVLARMDKQMPDDRKVGLADFVIHNDGTQSLIRQVLDTHRRLLDK